VRVPSLLEESLVPGDGPGETERRGRPFNK
jgi:hypothetical protein